jgi:hypothetical protein
MIVFKFHTIIVHIYISKIGINCYDIHRPTLTQNPQKDILQFH